MNTDMQRKIVMIQAELLNQGYTSREKTINKNGVELDTLEIMVEGENHPLIYVDDILRFADKEKKSIEEVTDALVKMIKERCTDIDFLQYISRDYLTDNMFIGMQKDTAVNGAAKRKSSFDRIEEYLYAKVECENPFTMMISEDIIKKAGMDLEEAWQQAEANTDNDTFVSRMSDYMAQLFMNNGGEELESMMEDSPMYIVTNTSGYKGAACVRNKAALKKIAAELKTHQLCAIPASIHEWLITSVELLDPVEVSHIVKEVNETEVTPEEHLADRAYVIEV